MVRLMRQVLLKSSLTKLIRKIPKEIKVTEINKNEEISISYVSRWKRWNLEEIIIDNNLLILHIMQRLLFGNEIEDVEPTSKKKCRIQT